MQKDPMYKDECLIYISLDGYTKVFLTVTDFQKFVIQILLNATYFYIKHEELPIPVATHSKVWICGYSISGIMFSNPTGVVYVCLL
jgi:hypothetical protein